MRETIYSSRAGRGLLHRRRASRNPCRRSNKGLGGERAGAKWRAERCSRAECCRHTGIEKERKSAHGREDQKSARREHAGPRQRACHWDWVEFGFLTVLFWKCRATKARKAGRRRCARLHMSEPSPHERLGIHAHHTISSFGHVVVAPVTHMSEPL